MAVVIAGVVLSAAYGWLWNVAAFATRTDAAAQAATIASAVSRAIAGDVRTAVAVAPPPAGRDPARSLALVHDHVDVAPEAVLTVWDPARRVVWRNASGTYLADHVVQLAVSYDLVDGRGLTGAEMMPRDWGGVRVVRVELVVVVGAAAVARTIETGVGPA